MGQYYVIANTDKGEFITPAAFDDGQKLCEFAYSQYPTVLAFTNLLAKRWHGDHVYVIGDYAVADKPEEPYYQVLADLQKRYQIDPGSKDYDRRSLYAYIYRHFKDVSGEVDAGDRMYRYVANLSTCQYIDLYRCPVEYVYYNVERQVGTVYKLSPLVILLTMGNGRGDGDYIGKGEKLAGLWCETSDKIRVAQSLNELPQRDLARFAPDFTEHSEMIPCSKGAEMLAKAVSEKIVH